MKKIEVSEAAIDSIKAMAQQLETERDGLLAAVIAVATAASAIEKREALDDCILMALEMEKHK